MQTNTDTEAEAEIFTQYNYLMDMYIDTIIKLIDTSYAMRILPLKIMFGLNYIKNHIQTNRLDILKNGLDYLLANKEIVLNFNIEKLNELDEDFDDNVSIKSCITDIKQKQKQNRSSDANNEFITESDEMLNLIIDIKNNAKKLSSSDIEIIKKYFELLIIILESIEKIFIQ